MSERKGRDLDSLSDEEVARMAERFFPGSTGRQETPDLSPMPTPQPTLGVPSPGMRRVIDLGRKGVRLGREWPKVVNKNPGGNL